VAQRGTATATIVFIDVVGSTEVRARLGEVAADQLFRAHERQLSEVVSAHAGRVVTRAGDGMMAAFDAASDAVSAAVAIQRGLVQPSPDLQIRVGVAAGDVSWEDGDCSGLPIVVAARLEADAEPGQILVSEVVRWLAGDRAGDRYEHLGPRQLKGLPQPIEVYAVGWDPPVQESEEDEEDTVAPVVLPAALTVAPGFGFVGRAEEWDELERSWSEVKAGGRRVVLVGGEAGAGKTRLASEFARRCHGEGAAVLFGACDRELAVPYQPWVQALDHMLRSMGDELFIEELMPALCELVVVLPQLERLVPGLGRPASVDPEVDRFRLWSAVGDVLDAAARRRPIVLVLDDLHWAGTQTLALLRHVARTASADQLLVMGTFRDTGDEVTDPLASCLADLRRLDGVIRLRLRGFDQAGVEGFIAQATGQELSAGLRDVAAAMTTRTAGNPFFLGELWRHLVASGTVVRSGAQWVTGPGIDAAGVPDSIKEVVAARVARLSSLACDLIGLAAIAGQRIELRVLCLAAERTEQEVAGPLDELVDAGLLADAGGAVLTYQFPHALVRESVADTVPPMGRARLHLRIAEALEAVHESDRRGVLADLARHFAAGASLGGTDKALYFGRRAGAQAVRSAAYDEAISHLDRAIALSRPGTPERIELLLDLGSAQLRDGRYLESRDTCGAAFEGARALKSADLAARAAIGFELAVHMPGLPGGPAVEVVSAAMAMLADDDVLTRSRLQASLARAYAHAGRPDDAVEAVEIALASAREHGDAESLGAALEAALIAIDDPHRLLTLTAELEEFAATSSDPWHELYATSSQLRGHIMLGQLETAAAVLDRHMAASDRGRYPTFQFVGHAYAVVLHLAAGRFDQAEESAERAHALGSAGNTPFDAGVYGLQMFAIRREQGRLSEVAPVLKLVSTTPTAQQPLWRPGLAALYADLGLLDDARREFEALAGDGFAAIPRDAVWPACASFLAEVCVALRDQDRAPELYEAILPFAGQNVMAGMTICFGPGDRFLGNLAALLQRPEVAEDHFRVALDLAERSPSPVWQAHVLHDLARFLADRGERAESVEMAGRARQLAMFLGMANLARRESGDEGVAPASDVRPATTPHLDGLSDRELDVLRLVADGCSNRDIGGRLLISQNTVANHVRSILQKTGCANRTEAASYAVRHDLDVP